MILLDSVAPSGLFYRSTSVFVLSVCLLATNVYCGKTAKRIELSFGMVSGVGPTNRVLGERIHWRHLANTVELTTVRGGYECVGH